MISITNLYAIDVLREISHIDNLTGLKISEEVLFTSCIILTVYPNRAITSRGHTSSGRSASPSYATQKSRPVCKYMEHQGWTQMVDFMLLA